VTASAAPGSATASESLAWYEKLRQEYRPTRIKVLLIGESPPDAGDGARRFFYSPMLRADNLYRGVAQAVYGERHDLDLRDKPRVLGLLRADGFWLIDAVDEPVNTKLRRERRAAIQLGVPRLVERAVKLTPERGVIICHSGVYAAAAAALRATGVRVLHDQALPFPLGNWRAQFVAGVRDALRSA
jgi:hypothetical protein